MSFIPRKHFYRTWGLSLSPDTTHKLHTTQSERDDKEGEASGDPQMQNPTLVNTTRMFINLSYTLVQIMETKITSKSKKQTLFNHQH